MGWPSEDAWTGIAFAHRFEVEGVRAPVTSIPHLPYIPPDWNGVLVLGEAQNLSNAAGGQVAIYSNAVRKMVEEGDERGLALRLTASAGWPDDFGDRPRVHVKPWHTGPVRLALACQEPAIDWQRCAVSNAVPWAWITAKGTDHNAMLKVPAVREGALRFLRVLFEGHPPALVVACGGKAHAVARRLGWPWLAWRQGSGRSLTWERRCHKGEDIEALTSIITKSSAQAASIYQARPDLYAGFNARDAALFLIHALKHGTPT